MSLVKKYLISVSYLVTRLSYVSIVTRPSYVSIVTRLSYVSIVTRLSYVSIVLAVSYLVTRLSYVSVVSGGCRARGVIMHGQFQSFQTTKMKLVCEDQNRCKRT